MVADPGGFDSDPDLTVKQALDYLKKNRIRPNFDLIKFLFLSC